MGYFSCMPSKAAARNKDDEAVSPQSRRTPLKKRVPAQRPLLVDIPESRDSSLRPSPDQCRKAHGPSPVVIRTRAIAGPISLNSGFNPYATEPSRRFTDEDLRARRQERLRAKALAKVAAKKLPSPDCSKRPASHRSEPERSPVPGLDMSFTVSLNDHDKGF